MRIGMAFVNVIGAVLLLIWLNITYKAVDKYDEFYYASAMKIKAEYASEAAFACYNSNDTAWLDTYCVMMCNMYDMGTSEENKDLIKGTIAAACYFGESHYEVLEAGHFNYKVALYSYKYEANDQLDINLFLGKDRVRGIDKVNLISYDVNDVDELIRVMGSSAGTVDTAYIKKYKPVIMAKIINNALKKSYSELSYSEDRLGYIPVFNTENGLNAIEYPSIIVVQKSLSHWQDTVISMAGYRREMRKYLVGFIEDGVKYYSRQEEAPDNWVNTPGAKMFRTIYEAAEAGYVPATHRFK